MNVEEKTGKLEVQVTKVQKDVSYLKKGMDTVNVKIDKLDEKTDMIVSDMPKIFQDIMNNYVTRKEFEELEKNVGEVQTIAQDNRARIVKFTITWSVISGVVVFLLSFGEQIAQFLTSVTHAK